MQKLMSCPEKRPSVCTSVALLPKEKGVLHRSVLWLVVAVALACAPYAQADTITSCTESDVKSAIATGTAIFGISCTVTLTSTITMTAGTTTIDGNGFAVTLDGNHLVGVLSVRGGVTLNLMNLTVANGQTASGLGGGVDNHGMLNVSKVTFTGNTNAIANSGIGVLAVTSSRFTDNVTGPNGLAGAIYQSSESLSAAATASIASSSFTGNGGSQAQAGGAIYVDGTVSPGKVRMTIDNSTFSKNTAVEGGAIYATSSQLTITDFSSFSGNGDSQTFTGGAIFASHTSMTVGNGTFFSNNTALEGGAIYARISPVTVTGSKFSGNTAKAGGFGGAIANAGSNVTVASGSEFDSNKALSSATAAGLGGAIYNVVGLVSCGRICLQFFPPSLTLGTVTFAKNSAAHGGAIYGDGNSFGSIFGGPGTIAVNHSYFVRNTATGVGSQSGLGGAIANEGGTAAQLTITSSTFEANAAVTPASTIAGKGNGIHNAAGALNVANCTFTDSALDGTNVLIPAGAIVNEGGGSVIVAYSTFSGNLSSTSAAPFLLVNNSGSFTLQSTILQSASFFNCKGSITDVGFNLQTGSSCPFSAGNHDLSNTFALLTNYGLNGGPTPTFQVPSGSPAIDQIPAGKLSCGMSGAGAVDQRDVTRPQGSACDMGAVEHLFANAPASVTTCNGVYNHTFSGNLTVFPGQSCVFLGGGVTGNVQVHGGHFELRYASVGGNIEDAGGTLALGPAAAVGGNVEIHDLGPGTPTSELCGAAIGGNVEVHDNRAAVAVGAQDQTTCLGNRISGSLDVHNNSAATAIVGNTVRGDVQDHNNSGATEVFENVVHGTLTCRENDAIAAGQDVASRKLGQCANF